VAQTVNRARRRWVLIAIAVVVLFLVILGALSGFYVDLLWFREVGFTAVFWKIYRSKVGLGAIFGITFFVLLLANLLIAKRLTPRFRVYSPEQEAIERYRTAIEPHSNVILPVFAAIVSLFVGIAVSGQWQTFLLWKSVGSVHFPAGHLDPVFHRDPTFYIFVLPFQQFVQGWLFSSLVGVTVLTVVAHYINGGIRVQAVGERVTPQVKAHLSVLLGLIVLVKAWGYYLGKFGLLVSSRGGFTGADYTDLHAQLPALRLLVFIAIACSILFLVNIRFRGWALPVLGIGLLGLVSIVIGAIYPAVVQRFQVQPQLFQKERPYILRNIDATRYAFGLSGIKTVNTSPTTDITLQQVQDNAPTVSNIRLWAPARLQQTYESLQRIQPYYEFSDVDVDRYLVKSGGAYDERVVMLSAREVSQDGIPSNQTWQNRHLVYTHGFGAVASLANAVTSDGSPDFLLQNVPVQQGGGGVTQFPAPGPIGSQIYYCEAACAQQPYVVVDTKQKELNYQNPTNQQTNQTHYQGTGGIPIGGFFKRAVFAFRYRDFNLLISGLIDSNSKILINRDIRARINKAAPFLRYDADPYAAVVGGRLVYIQDAYTSTSAYPYSQQESLSAATNSLLSGTANYIRNSVKVVVDAYNGTMKLYVVDPSDPLIQVWENAFPDLFTTTTPPAILRSHFRYPENLLQTQATVFSSYHVTDPQTFFQKGRQWQLPGQLRLTPTGVTPPGTLQPYYVLLKLPDQLSNEQFVLFEPFTPQSRGNMVAYIAAGSDGYGFPGARYGKLSVYQFPSGENIDGPQQVRNFISQDPAVSAQLTLLGQQGSEIQFGDLLIVPIDQSFLYVQPIFTIASGAGANPIPQLKRVVVVHGGNVTIASTFTDALAQSFGVTAPPPGGGQPAPSGSTVDQLLAAALQHFQAADAALKKGDLATYQFEINKAQDLVAQAEKLAAKQKGGTSTGSSPSPSPFASSSPSPSPTG
jgi:uncharacterized protein